MHQAFTCGWLCLPPGRIPQGVLKLLENRFEEELRPLIKRITLSWTNLGLKTNRWSLPGIRFLVQTFGARNIDTIHKMGISYHKPQPPTYLNRAPGLLYIHPPQPGYAVLRSISGFRWDVFFVPFCLFCFVLVVFVINVPRQAACSWCWVLQETSIIHAKASNVCLLLDNLRVCHAQGLFQILIALPLCYDSVDLSFSLDEPVVDPLFIQEPLLACKALKSVCPPAKFFKSDATFNSVSSQVTNCNWLSA